MPFEYFQEQLDDLQSKAILPDIIEHLEDARNLMLLRFVPVSTLQYTTHYTIRLVLASSQTIAAALCLKEVVDPAAHYRHTWHGLRYLLLWQVLITIIVQTLLPLLQLSLLEVDIWTRIRHAIECKQEGTLRSTLHGCTRVLVDAEDLESWIEGEVCTLGCGDLADFFVNNVLFIGRWHLGAHLA